LAAASNAKATATCFRKKRNMFMARC
jgi:hypothetical protein